MRDAINNIRSTPLKNHIGTGVISFIAALVDILIIRYAAQVDDMAIMALFINQFLWLAGLCFFKDWEQFKGVAPISIVMTLLGSWAGLHIHI